MHASTEPAFEVSLRSYRRTYRHRRGRLTRCAWALCSLILFESGWFPLSRLKTLILRLFGATIGKGLVIKTHVRIKYPWLLSVGDDCWIGQEVWIDNLDAVSLGNDVCLSQAVYLCTGSHDADSRTFDLITRPIHIENGAWIAARSTVLGGVVVQRMGVVAAGAVVSADVSALSIVGGCPARDLRKRGLNVGQ